MPLDFLLEVTLIFNLGEQEQRIDFVSFMYNWKKLIFPFILEFFSEIMLK